MSQTRTKDIPQHENEFADHFRDSSLMSPLMAGVPTKINRGSYEDCDPPLTSEVVPPDPLGFKPKAR